MSLKWSSIIFAPVALLLFLLIAGTFVYRGLYQNDWSAISGDGQPPKALMALGGIIGIYILFCCIACAFGVMIYTIHHALTRPKLSAITEDP